MSTLRLLADLSERGMVLRLHRGRLQVCGELAEAERQRLRTERDAAKNILAGLAGIESKAWRQWALRGAANLAAGGMPEPEALMLAVRGARAGASARFGQWRREDEDWRTVALAGSTCNDASNGIHCSHEGPTRE